MQKWLGLELLLGALLLCGCLTWLLKLNSAPWLLLPVSLATAATSVDEVAEPFAPLAPTCGFAE
jgi:hypothetical protein